MEDRDSAIQQTTSTDNKAATPNDGRYTKSQALWRNFLEPTLILTLIAAILYVTWLAYCYRYFSILSFPYNFANLQNGFVMPRIILYMSLTNILYFALFCIGYFYIEPKLPKLVRNIVVDLIYFGFLILFLFGPWFSILDQNIGFILGVFVGGAIGLLSNEIYKIIFCKNREDIIGRFLSKMKPMFEDWDNMRTIIVLLLLLNFIIPSQLAQHDAKALIEGRSGTCEIKLDLNETIMNLSNNATFILMTEHAQYHVEIDSNRANIVKL